MPEFPPTIIVVHPKERRSKCTVEPLRGRPGFAFWKFPQIGSEPLAGYVRLGLGSEPLTPSDCERGLLVLDGTWRLAARMEAPFVGLPVRSLLPWRTAYPRVSKLFHDPAQGLATIEALFAAFTQMGRPTIGVLDGYRWKDRFLGLNAEFLMATRDRRRPLRFRGLRTADYGERENYRQI
jgi:pre-rRNA-processing protein TSR3